MILESPAIVDTGNITQHILSQSQRALVLEYQRLCRLNRWRTQRGMPLEAQLREANRVMDYADYMRANGIPEHNIAQAACDA
jgi:hypothetical protein